MAISQRRQREKQERRAQILEAARTVFRKKGFLVATMDEVASEAELSKGTLYLYFKSKDDLLMGIGISNIRDMAVRFEDALDRNETGLETVAAMMRSYAEFALDRPRDFRNMASFLASGQSLDTSLPQFTEYRDAIAGLTARMVTAIERGQGDGSVTKDVDSFQTATQIWAGMLGICILTVNSEEVSRRMQQTPDFSTFVSGYINIIRAGVAGGRIDQ